MTQMELTEAHINQAEFFEYRAAILEIHARELAAKLTKVMEAAEDAGWLGEPAIRAIVRPSV